MQAVWRLARPIVHIGASSTDIETFCLATLRNTTEDNAGELFHLWVVSRQRTDRFGKLWTARQAFPNALCDLRMVDDNPDVCREFIALGQVATHIRLAVGRTSFTCFNF